jgi:hypothetical protein
VKVDPIASMRCWAVTVELGGREFEIPALPAADWWSFIADGDPSVILDRLKSDDPVDDADLDSMILDGTITAGELGSVLGEAIEEVTGRSMHVSMVLATVATMHWPVIGGELARRGFRWDVLPIAAALDAIYAVVVEGMEEKNRTKFLALLENETLTQPGKKRAPSERVMNEFETMAGPRPDPAPLPGRATAGQSGSPRPRTRTRPRPRPQGGPAIAPKPRPS